MDLGRQKLALKYGEAKKLLYQSERTEEQDSVDSDLDVIRHRYEGTRILPAGVNRSSLKFAGVVMGNPDKVSSALLKMVAGPNSKLTKRMIPFLNSPLVKLQHKLCILHAAAGERSLFNYLARGQSREQTLLAFEAAEILFRGTYERLLQQPAGTFDPGQSGWHKEQAELPRYLGGFNLPTLKNLQEPAAAGAMVGIIDYLANCKLLGSNERDPQQWYNCTSPRLREASASIKKLIGSPYFEYMNNSKMAEIYCTLVEPPIDGDINPNKSSFFAQMTWRPLGTGKRFHQH